MEYTKNLRLSKPSYDDDVDVQILNNNMNILDDESEKIAMTYIKSLVTTTHGIVATKGNNVQENLSFITDNYTDDDTNKVLNLRTLKQFLGEGAIISSKLTKNGYIKFANGFIIQWGETWFPGSYSRYVDVTLNTPCDVFVALSTDSIESVTTSGIAYSIAWNSGFSKNNKTSIRFLANEDTTTGNFTWACFGKA